jgi:threonine/homoserine/homoserine lactone efflux protein
MSLELLAAFLIFAVVTLFTPGPNNIMLMASGLNFGLARTAGHVLGVALGFALMFLLVGVGLGALFTAYPTLYTVLKYAGAAYLLYFAWLIASADPAAEGGEGHGRPMTFLEAAAFQWVNPKGWVVAVGATASYAAFAGFPANIAVMTVVFAVLGVLSALTWAWFGSGLRVVLRRPRAVRAFNVVMALLLVASIYPVVADVVR